MQLFFLQNPGVSGFFPIFGISPIDGEGNGTALDLFNQAALTAEEIKDDLQYHIRVYDPKVHERHVEEFKLLTEFQDALKNGNITFYLQPICRVPSGKIVYFDTEGRRATTAGWKGYGEYYYYTNASGVCAVNTTINGIKLDELGRTKMSTMDMKAQGYSSNTNYLVLCDKTN